MGLPQDLITQAERLARQEPKRPKQASLRRAVSSAYYGLFHFLIEEACSFLLTQKQSHKLLRGQLARSFEHAQMKNVSNDFVKSSQSNPWVMVLGKSYAPSSALQQVARTFVDLQKARHQADYNLLEVFNRSEVLADVTRARGAMKAWSVVRGTPEAEAFLLAMLVRSRR